MSDALKTRINANNMAGKPAIIYRVRRVESTTVQYVLIKSIHVYRRLLSPVIGQQCRFTPTCSRYAEQAIELYGPARGSWLAAKRILRCHPLCRGGHDPVPGNEDLDGIDEHRADEQPG